METCLYCGKKIAKEEMTREHVIPQVLGGNIDGENPFIINNVCKRCNNTAGLFIDGIFAKQFLIKDKIDTLKSKYDDLNSDPYIPLLYFGIITDFSFNNKICELWMGRSGDAIFHFHDPYESKYNIPMVGKPTYIKSEDIDPGYVFLYIQSTNEFWQKATVNSVIKTFPKSTIYLGNGSHEVCKVFSEIPKELTSLHSILNDKLKEELHTEFSTDLHVHDRLIFKLALGLSGLFLKDDFILSEEANRLREAMWSKSNDKLQNLKISGSSFFTSQKECSEFLNMDNCHVITLIKLDQRVALHISLFGDMPTAIVLTENANLLNVNLGEVGIVYVISPGLRKCIGPINLESFIAYKTEKKGDPRLLELEQEINAIPEYPPFN